MDENETSGRQHMLAERAAADATHSSPRSRELQSSIPPLQVPTDRPRRGSPTHTVDLLHLKLPTALSQSLRSLARRHDVSLLSTLLSAWALLLSRWSDQQELMIGVQMPTRRIEPAKHRAANMPALHISVTKDGSVAEFLKTIESSLAQTNAGEAMLEHEESQLDAAPSARLRAAIVLTQGDSPCATARPVSLQQGTPANSKLELTLVLRDVDGFLRGTVEYAADLFNRDTIEIMAGSWLELLRGIARHVRRPLARLGLLTSMERQRVLVRNNDTSVPYSLDRPVHELFEEQARRTPDAVAVEHEAHVISYADLNARANQLARYLRQRGSGANQLVAICMERGIEMIVAVLGILKSGAAYVPLDPNYPTERLTQMLDDAAPALVLTQARLRPALPATSAAIIELEAHTTEIAGSSPQTLCAAEIGLSPQSRVYVIFTSGSTGRPKGTEMAHASMANLLEWHRHALGHDPAPRVLQFAALSFDVAFQEIFSTLCTGGTLVLLDEWVRRDPRALLHLLHESSVQRWFVPPLVLQAVAEVACDTGLVPANLHDVITAGEQLRISAEIITFFGRRAGCRLHNHYGPTESHVVTAATLADAPASWPLLPSIGRPIANTQIYVLDEQLWPVPTGVAGEIYIGGANVALGYLNRPALTAQRFIPNVYSKDPHARLYKTGDLARWLADGTLEYLGRSDDQVKIRGFRVEPGEVEAQLMLHPSVREAAVIARSDGGGAKSLVAYVTQRGEKSPTVEELRAHLSSRLPEHLVPSAFVILEALPVTPSGKLDRRRLPAPPSSAYLTQEYDPPRGETEETVAAIWRSLLRLKHVGRHDNFFALGGDSLLMARMMELLRRTGLSVEARTAFLSPTLAALASELKMEASVELAVPRNGIPPECTSITPQMLALIELTAEEIELIVQAVPGGAANIQDIYPLAPLQEGLLFHHLLGEGAGDPYVVPTLLSVSSRDRLDELITALQAVVARHDALRTAILWQGLSRPVQVVYRAAAVSVETVVLDSDLDPTEQVFEWIGPKQQHLSLQCAPLVRVRVAAHPHDRTWYVLLQLHHIIADNTSQDILSSELAAHLDDEVARLMEPLPYRNHVAHALSRLAADTPAFFRSKLQQVAETTAPFGLSDVRGSGCTIAEVRSTLDANLADRVRAQARRLSTSPATIFHAAFALVVAHASACDDVVFGTVLLGRLHGSGDAQRMLGMFINTLPLRLRLNEATAKSLVEQTHLELSELLDYEQAPLAAAQRCRTGEATGPLFTALLNYRHHPSRSADAWLAADGIRVLAHRERTNYPITLSVDDTGMGFDLTAQTTDPLDPRRLVDFTCTALCSLVEALERADQAKVLSLAVLPANERYQVVEAFNATQRPYPRGGLVHELFEERVRQTPEAVAIVEDQQTLTYAALNAKANQLARYLRVNGVQSGDYVPIVAERSMQLVIAELAVLKAGAVYVPVDPLLPAERRAFIVRDCGARLILTQESMQPGLAHECQWLEFPRTETDMRSMPDDNLAVELGRPAAAYVMYTSGSTGVPKGVIVSHHGVLRLVINSDYAQFRQADCVAHASNPAFDASTLEVWGALLNGGKLVVVSQQALLDTRRLAGLLARQHVTMLWMTIGLLTQYVDALAGSFAQLRCLMTGGDVVDPEVVRRVLRNGRPACLLNAYGPTESTTFTTTFRIETLSDDVRSIPIGRPIANTRVYILNAALQPMPIGVPGEIYIGGEGVALGYLNRPDLTAERFIADPFAAEPGARLYRSGDLARWRADGNIEFLGRNDRQVKLRGFRIELGEIEAVLSSHPQLREAAVAVRDEGPDKRRLVAYAVPCSASALSAAELRAYVASILPEYMVPSAIVTLAALPLTANGKLDRRALPAPTCDAYVSGAYEPPQGDVEQLVAQIWSDLLDVERVGRDDDFFELGGHSLLAMRVTVRIGAALAVDIPINALFEFPTLRRLSARIEHIREVRLNEEIASGGEDIEALLEEVASLPQSRVEELMRELKSGSRQ